MQDVFIDEVDQSVDVVLQNLDGTPKTALDEGDITAAYRRGVTGASTPITPAVLATIGTAHTDGGFKEVHATQMPGVYRFDVTDALAASGVDFATLSIVTASALPCTLRISLVPRVTVTGGKIPATIAAGDIANDAITAASIASNAITAAKIANDAITDAKVASDVTIASVTGAVGSVSGAVGSVTGNVGGNVTGSVGSVASGGITTASFAAGAINAAAIGADAITDAKVAADVTIASVTGAVGSVTGNVGGNVTGSVGSVASGGLTAASFAANAITAAKLDPDVTTELQAGLATASALATVAGYLDTEVAATLAAVLNLVGAGYTRTGTAQAGAAGSITLDTGASSVDDFYNNQIVVIASGTGAGQGRFISDYTGSSRVAAVATWVTNPDNTSVFYTLPFGAIPGATAPTAAEVRQEIDNNSTRLAAIDAKTVNLPSDPADQSLVIVATDAIMTRIGAAGANLTALGDTRLANMDATVSSRATPAQVNAEVVDALNVDLYAEPTGAPPATASLARKINQSYKHLRNEVEQTATAQTVKNDDDSPDVAATVSDAAGTFTRGKWGAA